MKAGTAAKEGAKAEKDWGKAGIAPAKAENIGGIAIGLLAADTAAKEGGGKDTALEIVVGIETGLQEQIEKEAALGKAERSAHLAENAEGIVTGLLAAASVEKEGAKEMNGAHLAEKDREKVENAEIMVIGRGLLAADTAGTGAAGAHLEGRGAHLAEGNAEGGASASGTRNGGKAEASAKEALLRGKEAKEGLTAQNS